MLAPEDGKNEQRSAAHIAGRYAIVAALISGGLGLLGGLVGGWYGRAYYRNDVNGSDFVFVAEAKTEAEDSFITLADYLTLKTGETGLSELAQQKAAREHYGKRIHWKGYFQRARIAIWPSDERYFQLEISPTRDMVGWNSVYCVLPKSAELQVTNLVEGQAVKFSGILEGFCVHVEEFTTLEPESRDSSGEQAERSAPPVHPEMTNETP